MIQEAYCSDDVCKLLKEKGFKEPCTVLNRLVIESGEKPFTKITHQKAMAWLRKVHNIHIEIYVIKNYDKKVCKYTYTIMDLNFPGSDDGIDCCNKYNTYEDAVEAALKYVLENLI